MPITATPRLDRALDRRIGTFARLAQRTIAAANTLIHETEAVAKWDGGTVQHRKAVERRDRASQKYDELVKQLNEWIEELA